MSGSRCCTLGPAKSSPFRPITTTSSAPMSSARKMSPSTYAHTHTHTRICIHECMHACMHACIQTYIHTCIHACTHTHTHIDISASASMTYPQSLRQQRVGGGGHQGRPNELPCCRVVPLGHQETDCEHTHKRAPASSRFRTRSGPERPLPTSWGTCPRP